VSIRIWYRVVILCEYIKEKGQTLISDDLSSLAPAGIEMLNLWNDFRKVVKFIDENPWVKPLLEKIIEIKR
jgi:hypothetical protein